MGLMIGAGWNGLFLVITDSRLWRGNKYTNVKLVYRDFILFYFLIKGVKHMKAEMLSSLLKVRVNQWSN